MTDAERRRIELLEQTRKLYSDKNSVPAVHPRYQSAYHSLYKNEIQEERKKTGTFGARTVIAILLFCLFLAASRSEDMDTDMVVNQIEQEFRDVADLPIFD